MSKTAEKIMQVFKKYGVGKNEIIMMGSLTGEKFKWERNHQDNFADALQELEDKGFFIVSKDFKSVELLEAGYNFLYS